MQIKTPDHQKTLVEDHDGCNDFGCSEESLDEL